MVDPTVTDDGLWELPGPTKVVGKVLAGISHGNNVTVVIPECQDAAGIAAQIHDRLDAVRPTHVLRPRATCSASDGDLLDQIEQELGVTAPPDGAPLSVRYVMTDWLISSQFLLIIDLTRFAPDEAEEWSRALHRHAAFMRPQPPGRRVGVVVLCRDKHLELLPSQDVNVTHVWWWGVLDRLDMLFATRDDRIPGPHGEVRMNMIVEIGAFDIGLVRHLVARWDGDHRRLIDPLVEYGKSAHDPEIAAAHAEGFSLQLQRVIPGDPVPSSLRPAWNAGLVELWEGAAGWHRSFLAALAPERPDALRELTRLAWRAQVATFLPSIEFARHAIARSVADLRRNLPSHSTLAKACESGADVEGLEYLELQEYLRAVGNDPRLRDLERLVDRLRRFRNRLAHVDPRNTEQIHELLELIQDAREAAR
jgi:hypothetical protein